MKLLDKKYIIVTGSAKGIGKKMVEVFAENGANVFALARSINEDHDKYCQELSNKYNVLVKPYYVDLTEFNLVKEIVSSIKKDAVTGIDGLVNNAGITFNSLFQMTGIDDLRKQFESNFFAPFIFTQYISKLMVRNKKGSIVSISSSAALDCNSGKSAYGSSKAALLCMTKCISQELGEYGIRANVICPGVTETDMLGTMPEYIMDIQMKASSLKEVGKPLDIANTAMFLLSDNSSYITGQVFKVDGGVTQFDKRK